MARVHDTCLWAEGRADLVEVLLKHGANPELKDGRGFTPLEAAREQQHETVEAVLSNR
jgi:ankyrin repeat protein